MDLTRPVVYRDFELNTTEMLPGIGVGTGIDGCVIDSADMSDVDVVQFLEKRSLQDGMDAGDVFLGKRTVRMAGTLYAPSRNLLYDRYLALRAALSPVLAQRDEPADKGYRPLYFSLPTDNREASEVEDSQGKTVGYPAGAIDMRVLALPRAFQAVFQRNNQGGNDTDPLALPWQATFICKDPTIQGETPQDYTFTDTVVKTGTATTSDFIHTVAHGLAIGDRVYFTSLTGGTGLTVGTAYYVVSSGFGTDDFRVSLTSGGAQVDITVAYSALSWAKVVTQSGNLVNRGNYLGVLNMIFAVSTTGGTIVVSAGGSNFTITVPSSSNARIIRYKGADKILTVEENDVEALRMDLLTFQNQATHPIVPAGVSPYTVTFTGVVLDPGTTDGSHMWHWETFA